MKLLRHWLWTLRHRWDLARLAGPSMLQRYAQQYPQAFFVQIGANDGEMMDPLRKLILTSAWRGVLVEPVPHLYARLQDNYAQALGRVLPVNLAIATEAGALPFFHLSAPAGLPPLPDWAEGLGSFRRDVVLKHGDRITNIENYLTEIKVPSQTWDGFCEQQGISRLDVLVTDTEGYDFEIIRQIDFKRWKPTLIVYEHHHFSAQTRKDCQQLLHSQGYQMFEEGLDTWGLHADAGAGLIAHMRRAVRRSRFAAMA